MDCPRTDSNSLLRLRSALAHFQEVLLRGSDKEGQVTKEGELLAARELVDCLQSASHPNDKAIYARSLLPSHGYCTFACEKAVACASTSLEAYTTNHCALENVRAGLVSLSLATDATKAWLGSPREGVPRTEAEGLCSELAGRVTDPPTQEPLSQQLNASQSFRAVQLTLCHLRSQDLLAATAKAVNAVGRALQAGLPWADYWTAIEALRSGTQMLQKCLEAHCHLEAVGFESQLEQQPQPCEELSKPELLVKEWRDLLHMELPLVLDDSSRTQQQGPQPQQRQGLPAGRADRPGEERRRQVGQEDLMAERRQVEQEKSGNQTAAHREALVGRTELAVAADAGPLQLLLEGMAGSGVLQAVCASFCSVPRTPPPRASCMPDEQAGRERSLWLLAGDVFALLQYVAQLCDTAHDHHAVKLLAAPEVQRLLVCGLHRLGSSPGGGASPASPAPGGPGGGGSGSRSCSGSGAAPAPGQGSRGAAEGACWMLEPGALCAGEGTSGAAQATELLRRLNGTVLFAAAATWLGAMELGAYASPMPPVAQLPRLVSRALEALHRLYRAETAEGGGAGAWSASERDMWAADLKTVGVLLAELLTLLSDVALARACFEDVLAAFAFQLALLTDEALVGGCTGRAAADVLEATALVARLGHTLQHVQTTLKDAGRQVDGRRCKAAIERSHLTRSLDAALRMLLRGDDDDDACDEAVEGAARFACCALRIPSLLLCLMAGVSTGGGGKARYEWESSRDLGACATLAKAVRGGGVRLQRALRDAAAATGPEAEQALTAAAATDLEQHMFRVATFVRDLASVSAALEAELQALAPPSDEPARRRKGAEAVMAMLFQYMTEGGGILAAPTADAWAAVRLCYHTCIQAAVPVLDCQVRLLQQQPPQQQGTQQPPQHQQWEQQQQRDVLQQVAVAAAACTDALRSLRCKAPPAAAAWPPPALLSFLASVGRYLAAAAGRGWLEEQVRALFNFKQLAEALAGAASSEALCGQARAVLRETVVSLASGRGRAGDGPSPGGGGSEGRPQEAEDSSPQPQQLTVDLRPLLYVLPAFDPQLEPHLARLVRKAASGCGDAAFRREAEEVGWRLTELDARDPAAPSAGATGPCRPSSRRQAVVARRGKGRGRGELGAGGGDSGAGGSGACGSGSGSSSRRAAVRLCGNPGCERFEGRCEADALRGKVCGGCRAVRYCCVDCQVAHWRGGHREDCRRLPHA